MTCRMGVAEPVSGHRRIDPGPLCCRLHDVVASHAIDEGAPITLVSQTLGHADLKTTSVYAHARPNDSSSRYLKRR